MIHVRKHQWHGNVLSLIPWQLLSSLIFLVPLSLIIENPSSIRWEPGFLVNILFSGALASGVCVAAQIGAIRSLPAVTMSLSSAAVPAVGLISSAILLGEMPGYHDVFGFLMIGLGIVLVGLTDWRLARARVSGLSK